MILRRLILALAGAAAFAASAAVFILALAFALYALIEPELGRAGAAAVVAGAAALLIVLAALGIGMARRRKTPAAAPRSFLERAMDLVREKPVVAVSAALAAGFLAIRNPKYLGAAIRAFVEGRPPPG